MSVTTPLQPTDNGADSLDILNGNFEAVEQLVEDEIAETDGEIIAIQGDISTIQGDISTIEGDISTINGTVGDIQGDITDLEETLEDTINDGAPLATTVVKGRSKLSVAPVDADEPIAVGDNDPRLVATVTTSSGASDEGKVAKLNARGKTPVGFFAGVVTGTGDTLAVDLASGQKVLCFVKGAIVTSATGSDPTITLAYDSTTKDSITTGFVTGVANKKGSFSLMFYGDAVSGNKDLTVSTSAGTLADVSWVVLIFN